MKKTLIALAALAATGAFAQVSVYGRLDAGYGVNTITKNDVDTKLNGVTSNNNATSLWGIQGTEDLGAGMKANFKLEQDVYTANGALGASGAGNGATTTSSFNRISKVGLSGGFGSVSFGRDYLPTFSLAAGTDVMGQTRFSTIQLSTGAGYSTTDSLVMYSTPVMSGFQVNVAYRNGDTSSNTGDNTDKVTNLTATYTNGPLMVGVGTGSAEVRTANGTATAPAQRFATKVTYGLSDAIYGEKVSSNIVAASYDFGTFKLLGNYITSKTTNAAAAASASTAPSGVDVEANELNLGAVVPMGKVSLVAAVGTNTLKATGVDARKGTDMSIGADYNLSSKTVVYLRTGTVAKLESGRIPTSSTTSAANGEYKATGTAIGIRTVF